MNAQDVDKQTTGYLSRELLESKDSVAMLRGFNKRFDIAYPMSGDLDSKNHANNR